jgi:hypothetical protein
VLKAGLWSTAVLSLVIRFGSNLLMTRLLLPDMFGVMAIASTVKIGLAMFRGRVAAERGQKRPRRRALVSHTAWTIDPARGRVLDCHCLRQHPIGVAARVDAISPESVYAAQSLPMSPQPCHFRR